MRVCGPESRSAWCEAALSEPTILTSVITNSSTTLPRRIRSSVPDTMHRQLLLCASLLTSTQAYTSANALPSRASGLSIPHRAALRSVRLSIDDEDDANKQRVTICKINVGSLVYSLCHRNLAFE